MAESFIQLPTDGTGKRTRTLTDIVGGNTVHTQYVVFRREPTFVAAVNALVPAVGHLFVILNRNSAKVVRIYRVNVYISEETAVTGVLLKLSLERVTATAALSGGTAITPTQFDTNDAFPASIDVMARPTSAITTVREFKRFLLSSDEAVVSTLDADAFAASVFPRDTYAVLRHDFPMVKPFTLRTNGTTFEGFSVRGLLGTVGNLGIEVLFTVDDQ